MLILAFLKIAATSCTISSGGSGGVFGPSFFIGAMLGGAFGYLGHELAPGWVVNPNSFILVGIGGFFAGLPRYLWLPLLWRVKCLTVIPC